MTAIGTLPVVLGTGIHASRPAASAVGKGGLYSCTTHSLVYQTDGSSWTTWATLGGSTVDDATIATTDITTNNASTSKHGWLKKLSNVSTEYMSGTGVFSTPSAGTPTAVSAGLFHSTTQSRADGSALVFDSETWDTSSFHDNVTNNSRLVVPSTGKYLVTLGGLVSVSTSQIKIRKNGGTPYVGANMSPTNGWQTGTWGLLLTAADYIEFWHTTGTVTYGHASAFEAQMSATITLVGA